MGKSKLGTPRKKSAPLTISIARSRPTSTTVSNSQNKTAANIKVIVRVRPPNEREQAENYK